MKTHSGLLILTGALAAAAWSAEVKPVDITVCNERLTACREVVRVALPVPVGLIPGEPPQAVSSDRGTVLAQASVITRHTDGSARRVMLSVPVELAAGESLALSYGLSTAGAPRSSLAQVQGVLADIQTAAWTLRWRDGGVEMVGPDGRALGTLRGFGPLLAEPQSPALVAIENGPLFTWLRWRQDGADLSREVDIQADSFGRIRLVQRLLRHLAGNDWCPDFGFECTFPGATPVRLPAQPVHFLGLPLGDPLSRHADLAAAVRLADGTELSLANPLALRQHRGTLSAHVTGAALNVRFSRLEPVAKESDGLLLQEGAWQSMEIILQPGSADDLVVAVDAPLVAKVDWRAFDAVYRTGPPLAAEHPVLRRLIEQVVVALQGLALKGDDLGSLGGLERYNHCAYLWEDWYRSGDSRLRRLALDYSVNYHDFSVNWGPNPASYGGSRYPPDGRTQPWSGSFRTRHNDAVTFCTKGFHGFWLAYEETGDPRFRYAAEQQANWSAEHLHATVNYTRCIGVVTDFVRLFEYTGERSYLAQAERLWTEFQACQDPDLLFNERGVPSTGNDLYVPDDRFGYEHPFVKSYIVQYATNALPDLLRHRPGDQRLRATILACNDWLARVQTAAGGWSYPGPTTAGFHWSTEYSHGLMLSYHIDPRPAALDAVQRELRAVVALFDAFGQIPAGVTPWESLEGLTSAELGQRYRLGADRDRSRDFSTGRIGFGLPPDFGVYLQVLLRDYLALRPEASLFTPDEVLGQILQMRTAQDGPFPQTGDPSLRIAVVARSTPEGLAATFSARGTYRLSGKRPTWHWTLPDGSVREGPEAAWVFPRAGAFAVTLTAQDGAAEYVRTVTLVAPTGPGDLGCQRWPQGLRVQAESFLAQGGGEVPVKIRTAAEKLGADGGSMSHWNAMDAWVEWLVEVPLAGSYALLLRYASPEASQRLVALNGEPVGTANLPPTGGYSGPDRDDWGSAVVQDAQGAPAHLALPAGAHRLRLTNTDGHGCNLDYWELLPLPQ
jgi:hypothetical protein